MNLMFWVVVVASVLVTAGIWAYSIWIMPKHINHRFRESVMAFSTAVELRFPSHTGLAVRVKSLSMGVGQRLGLDEATLRDLELAASLRDIGLCAVPYSLINERPERDWTPPERNTYMQHPVIGGAMLELIPSLRRLAPIVRLHHTPYRVDPKMPVEARILRVVTEYVQRERSYGHGATQTGLLNGAGTDFDPDVVDALLGVLATPQVATAP